MKREFCFSFLRTQLSRRLHSNSTMLSTRDCINVSLLYFWTFRQNANWPVPPSISTFHYDNNQPAPPFHAYYAALPMLFDSYLLSPCYSQPDFYAIIPDAVVTASLSNQGQPYPSLVAKISLTDRLDSNEFFALITNPLRNSFIQGLEVPNLTDQFSHVFVGLPRLFPLPSVVNGGLSEFSIDDDFVATAGVSQQLADSALAHQQILQTITLSPRLLLLQKMMMKQPKEKEVHYKTEEVEGPPLDYSFRNIRTLAELATMAPSESKPIPSSEDTKPLQNTGQQSSEKDLGQSGQTKLNIVRTIDVQGSKDDLLKHYVNKKTEKATSKVVKKTEVKTTSLFLRYNKITVLDGLPEILQQILPNKWQQLVWIDLSHNRLTKISLHLQALPQLKNLYLHVNFISSFKQFENLQGAKLLRTFTVHGNPIENFPEFRCLLVAILPQLQKLDSALLTKREKERAQVIKKQGGKYPIIQNPAKPPEDSEQQEQS